MPLSLNVLSPDCLKIGDFITLRNAKLDCYMCGEGILVEDVVVSDSIDLFEDALFCIQLQRQYSAARELEEFTELCAMEGSMISHTTEKYFSVLKVWYLLLILTLHFPERS